MKKNIGVLICLSIIISCFTCASAAVQRFMLTGYDLNGNSRDNLEAHVTDFSLKDGEGNLLIESYGDVQENEEILSNSKENEYFVILDMKVDDEENPYPEIEQTEIEIGLMQAGGTAQSRFGKDYRLIYIDSDASAEDLTSNITDSSMSSVSLFVDKLGKYILYYDPAAYSVAFFTGEPEYDEEGNVTNQYEEIDNLKKDDTIEFPEIPQKEGYVFTGWQSRRGSSICFTEPQPLTPDTYAEIYASWCPEEEYKPISIDISSDSGITKGEEDGQKILLTVDYGTFVSEEDFPSEWRPEYEAVEEEYREEIINDWKNQWNIVGSDEIMVEKAERIDDKTVELTLSGNSSDIYTSSDISVEFNSYLLLPEADEQYETKIQMDEDGVKRAMYISDNAITLTRQRRPGGGGSLAVSQYIISFDTLDGSEAESVRVANNAAVAEPQEPQREGYTFAGWYTDPECSNEYDFNTKVTKNITLYAKWEEAEPGTEEPNQGDVETDPDKDMIKLTIGEKDAVVFGETKTNDVAPLIRSDRAFLPSRFIAESLGADVEWDNGNRKVTITKDETMIEITIDSDIAVVNGEEVELDAAAFIENDRTYTPIRFISENLGAKVDWDPDTLDITITR